MTIEEILSQVEATIIAVSKRTANSRHKKIEGVHPLYKDACDMAEHISYHAVKGEYPEKLFENRSPNQTEREADYIRKNYKQYTLPEFMDYINTITRPFGDGNWNIIYRDEEKIFVDAEKTFQQYVEHELPIYGSLEEFIKSVLPTLKSIDANGYLGIRPKEINYVYDENGELVIDSQSLYEPTIYFYKSEDVIDYVDGEYYLFLSQEKSVVKTAGGLKKEGAIYELYTENEVYFFRQIGLKSDNKFEAILYFTHNAGKCPVIQTKGVPKLQDNSILWQSPFVFGVDLLDLVATNSNWLQFSVNKCVFPMTIMYGSPCEFKDENGTVCQDGYLGQFTEGGQKTCPSCSGTGLKGRLSPVGTLLIKPNSKTEDGEQQSSQPPLSYVSPEVSSLEFIEKKIDKDTVKARQILKLRNRNSVVSGQPITATEIFDDSKGMTAFIKPIIDQIFQIYEFCLKTIGFQRYGDKFKGYELTYPKSYDFKSPEDYLNDLTNAINNSLPPAFIQTLLYQYISSYYGDNEDTSIIYKIVSRADRLFALKQDEINMKMSKGTVAKWEDILHSSVLTFVNDSITADPKFIDKDITEQVKIVQDMAKKVEQDNSVSTTLYNSLIQPVQ